MKQLGPIFNPCGFCKRNFHVEGHSRDCKSKVWSESRDVKLVVKLFPITASVVEEEEETFIGEHVIYASKLSQAPIRMRRAFTTACREYPQPEEKQDGEKRKKIEILNPSTKRIRTLLSESESSDSDDGFIRLPTTRLQLAKRTPRHYSSDETETEQKSSSTKQRVILDSDSDSESSSESLDSTLENVPPEQEVSGRKSILVPTKRKQKLDLNQIHTSQSVVSTKPVDSLTPPVADPMVSERVRTPSPVPQTKTESIIKPEAKTSVKLSTQPVLQQSSDTNASRKSILKPSTEAVKTPPIQPQSTSQPPMQTTIPTSAPTSILKTLFQPQAVNPPPMVVKTSEKAPETIRKPPTTSRPPMQTQTTAPTSISNQPPAVAQPARVPGSILKTTAQPQAMNQPPVVAQRTTESMRKSPTPAVAHPSRVPGSILKTTAQPQAMNQPPAVAQRTTNAPESIRKSPTPGSQPSRVPGSILKTTAQPQAMNQPPVVAQRTTTAPTSISNQPPAVAQPARVPGSILKSTAQPQAINQPPVVAQRTTESIRKSPTPAVAQPARVLKTTAQPQAMNQPPVVAQRTSNPFLFPISLPRTQQPSTIRKPPEIVRGLSPPPKDKINRKSPNKILNLASYRTKSPVPSPKRPVVSKVSSPNRSALNVPIIHNGKKVSKRHVMERVATMAEPLERRQMKSILSVARAISDPPIRPKSPEPQEEEEEEEEPKPIVRLITTPKAVSKPHVSVAIKRKSGKSPMKTAAEPVPRRQVKSIVSAARALNNETPRVVVAKRTITAERTPSTTPFVSNNDSLPPSTTNRIEYSKPTVPVDGIREFTTLTRPQHRRRTSSSSEGSDYLSDESFSKEEIIMKEDESFSKQEILQPVSTVDSSSSLSSSSSDHDDDTGNDSDVMIVEKPPPIVYSLVDSEDDDEDESIDVIDLANDSDENSNNDEKETPVVCIPENEVENDFAMFNVADETFPPEEKCTLM